MNDLVTSVRPPVVGTSTNPLLNLRERDMAVVAVGVTIASLRPKTKAGLRCYRNGEPLYPVTTRQWRHHLKLLKAGRTEDANRYLRKAIARELNWEQAVTKPGDIIAWGEMVHDKDTLRTVLQIAVLVAAIWVGGPAGAAIGVFGNVALSIFLAPSATRQDAQSQGGSVYSSSLTGNQAKLDQPIWRNCGVVKITPPFAAQPYVEYIDDDGDGLDADQYYFAVFALGIGRHEIIRTFVGDTPIEQLQDILEFNHLAVGQQPHRALCNVETSSSVDGTIQLESNGKYAGPFVACLPTRRAVAIGIDVSAPQGLGTSSDPLTISWRVEYAEVDDQGRILGSWQILAEETRTAETNTPQRWSNKYNLVTPIRPLIRLVRTDIKNTAVDARADMNWLGLRAYLSAPAPLNPNTEHLEIVMRASSQLSGSSQSDFAVLLKGMARTWNPDTGWSCDLYDYEVYEATRNPAWYIADQWADGVWGEGFPDARIDLQGLYDYAQLWEQRQDHFDYTFDTAKDAWEAVQLTARAGRAQAFRRFGVNTIARDELATLPSTAFSPRNTEPDSMSVTEKTPDRDSNDGVIVEYTSNVTWDIVTIDCPCPGFTVTSFDDPRYNPDLPMMTRPVYIRLEGIKGAKQAEREGLYEAAKMMLRTRTVGLTTEMEGVAVSVLDPILWQPELAGYAQSGDVASWNVDLLVMELTEPADFSGSDTTYLTLMRDDGTLTEAVPVTAGSTQYEIVLPAEPDFELILDDDRRERPKFFLGHIDQLARVTSITDGGKADADEGEEGAQLYDIQGYVDDDRIHQADVHLLPGPGEIQDPIDDGSGAGVGPGDGTLLLVRLSEHFLSGIVDPTDNFSIFTLTNDGFSNHANVNFTTDFPNEWMQYQPVELAQAGLFDVRFTYTGQSVAVAIPYPPNSGDVMDTWLSLDTNRSIGLSIGPDTLGQQICSVVRCEIRLRSTGVVQVSRLITLFCALTLA